MTDLLWNYIRLLLALLIIAMLTVLIHRSNMAIEQRSVMQESCIKSIEKTADLLEVMQRQKELETSRLPR